MRTASRLVAAAVALGGSLLLAPAASAQVCDYPFNPADPNCAPDVIPKVQDRPQDASSTNTVDAATLPFTGGELTMLSLAGAGALGGGVALVLAGRKRRTA